MGSEALEMRGGGTRWRRVSYFHCYAIAKITHTRSLYLLHLNAGGGKNKVDGGGRRRRKEEDVGEYRLDE